MKVIKIDKKGIPFVYIPIPTGTRELDRLFLSYNLNCTIIKNMREYDLVFKGNPVIIIPRIANTISELSLKEWLLLVLKYHPIYNTMEELLYTQFSEWPNFEKYIKKENK